MKMTATSIMTAKTPAAGTDLLQIVHINEEIKRVVGLPFDAAKWFGPEILQGL